MDNKDHLEAHLLLCERVFQRMLRENSFPWDNPDSPNQEDLLESSDNH